MRVLFLVNAPRANLTGGAARALALADRLARVGIRSAIAAPPASAVEQAAREAGIAFHPVTFRPTPRDVRRLRAVVREERPDVVHALSTVPIVLARPDLLTGRGSRTRPALFVSILVDPSSELVYADGRRRGRATEFRNRLLARVAPRLDGVFAVSTTVGTTLEGLGVRGRVVVTGAMLDIEDLERRAAVQVPLPPGRPRLGIAAGQLERLKGVDHLIRAVATLGQAHPEATCLVTGDGAEREPLGKLADELGVGGRVELPGYVEDSAPYVAALDVCVSPSLTEGLPGALAEALALGVPVVATDVGGVRDLIDDGRTGLLVPPADPDAIASAVERLLADPAFAQRLSEQGRAEVALRHEASRVFEVYRAEYVRALATRGEPHDAPAGAATAQSARAGRTS